MLMIFIILVFLPLVTRRESALPAWLLLPSLSLRPSPRLILIFCMEDMDILVMGAMVATMVSVRLMLSQRLMLNPTCMDMEDMDWDTLAIPLDIMDIMVYDIAILASVRLRLSQRLMLTLTFCMVDMDWDALAILLDSMDIILDILTTMASVKLSPRLTPTFFMEDMDTLDMLDTTDTPMLTLDMLDTLDMLLMLSPRLTPTFCTEDMDILDTPDTMDTPIAPIATTVKLFPLVLWTANHPCFLYQ